MAEQISWWLDRSIDDISAAGRQRYRHRQDANAKGITLTVNARRGWS
jgi:hypothetical protein